MDTSFFTASSITVGYGSVPVCRDLSFSLEKSTLTALVGTNGSGKSTLIKALCGLLPHTGSCTLDGQPLEGLSTRQIARQLSYIPQRSGIRLSLSVLEVVLMGYHARLGLFQSPSAAEREAALQALSQFGIEAYATRDYLQLSEGQKQLCILARTLVEDTKLLLLDEPDSALDYPNRHHMMQLLGQMVRGQSRCALLCLHDLTLALEYCDRLLLLKDGTELICLQPQLDTLGTMERALRYIYGDMELVSCGGSDGRRHLMLLPAGAKVGKAPVTP